MLAFLLYVIATIPTTGSVGLPFSLSEDWNETFCKVKYAGSTGCGLNCSFPIAGFANLACSCNTSSCDCVDETGSKYIIETKKSVC